MKTDRPENKISLLSVSLLAVLLAGCSGEPKQPGDGRFSGPEFNEHVRSTEPRTPEEERLGFRLPPGFEITLYASEPDIGKPMNIAFDAEGRMWVSQSHEYPFPAEPGGGKDRISILEDTDGDGTADRFTHFNDTLNIPIGLLPMDDGAVVYSIPNVYKYTDGDQDGEAEDQRTLFGPFRYTDTHGMVNGMTRGYDGWIHACHGFNVSTVAGTDGDSARLVYGSTFRFRPDGSRVEEVTYGRINPFGMVYDERGYLYSTDCHTSPLYQLIRGGDYTQWGKEVGMGFAPDMKPLEREATALAGISYYSDVLFPEEFRNNFYIGDVVACRIYRNSFTNNGSSPVGKMEPDFLLSEDPWFRPVDIKLGPDGALYVADFYNRIIGHYEVPLDHPGRDKVRGRIWRITYKGSTHAGRTDWTTAPIEELIAALSHDNLPLRMTVTDQLTDRIGKAAVEPLRELLENEDTKPVARVHALWALYRLHALTPDLIRSHAENEHALVRLHTFRILFEKDMVSAGVFPLIVSALKDRDPHVSRAALEALTHYPEMNTLETVLQFRHQVPEQDDHLLYTARLCLRNLVRDKQLMTQASVRKWAAEDARALCDIMTGLNTVESAAFLRAYLGNDEVVSDRDLPRLLQHAARFGPAGETSRLTAIARERAGDDPDTQFRFFSALRTGLQQGGLKENTSFASWGRSLAATLMDKHFPKGQPHPTGSKADTAGAAAQQQLAAELAGQYGLKAYGAQLGRAVEQGVSPQVKVAAARALMQLAPHENADRISALLNDKAKDLDLRTQVASMLGEFPGDVSRQILAGATDAPYNLQLAIVKSLAGSSEGKDLVFRQVKEGKIFPRTLLDPPTAERILLNSSASQKKTYEELTADVTPLKEEKQALLWARMVGFSKVAEDAAVRDSLKVAGEQVFAANCSPCHQVNGQGGTIGPQLTGIGNWGANALAVKILDPNRNVLESFRTYTVKTRDGKVFTGLLRRDEGKILVFADVSGTEFSLAKEDIEQQQASGFTLMPDQFGDILSQDEFNALLTYLLSLKSETQ